MRNLIVLNRTVYMYKNGFGIKKPWKGWYTRTIKPNKQTNLVVRRGSVNIYIYIYIYMYVCVCVYIYTHTHIHPYIYIYIYVCVCVYMPATSYLYGSARFVSIRVSLYQLNEHQIWTYVYNSVREFYSLRIILRDRFLCMCVSSWSNLLPPPQNNKMCAHVHRFLYQCVVRFLLICL